MTTFLTGKEITKRIRDAARSAATCDFAVAYWGGSGARTLQLPSTSQIRVICDAYSGACNPSALLDLLKMPNVSLRTCDGLHSKVYIMDGSAVVGSANASANGLGEEDSEAKQIEAAVQFDDSTQLGLTKAWFEKTWKASRRIDESDIEAIRPLWRYNRATRPPRRTTGTLIESVRSNPSGFRDKPIRVIAYHDVESSTAALKHYRAKAKELYSPGELAKYEKSGTAPYYEAVTGWDVREGEYILDFHYPIQGGKLRAAGIWKVLKLSSIGKNHRLIFVDQVFDLNGLKYPKSDQSDLAKLLGAYLEHAAIGENSDGNLIDIQLADLPALIGATAR